MRQILLALLVWVFAALPGAAQDASAEIRGVIKDQLQAFQADDLTTAFGFASSGIQGMFGTPENFGLMVQQGYPMIWRPSEVHFLGQHDSNGVTQQDVQFTDQAGRRFVAEYTMVQTPDGWRISAVQILPAPDVGV